jgi:hypothetical protein
MVTRGAVQVPAVPEDVAAPGVEKATGVIVLPLHIAWSGPPRSFDLSDRRQRARVYEQVLREGNHDDVRYFVDVDELLDLWDELFLPRRVRLAWADWFRRHRGIEIPC